MPTLIRQSYERYLSGTCHPGLVNNPHENTGVRIPGCGDDDRGIRHQSKPAFDIRAHGANIRQPVFDKYLSSIVDLYKDYV
jgi:hypothetical protein